MAECKRVVVQKKSNEQVKCETKRLKSAEATVSRGQMMSAAWQLVRHVLCQKWRLVLVKRFCADRPHPIRDWYTQTHTPNVYYFRFQMLDE